MRAKWIFSIFFVAIICILPLHAIAGQEEELSPSKIVESTVLWNAQIDEVTWEPIELSKLLNNSEGFTKAGNFYKVNSELKVFGHKALYIGMRGIEFIPGPNVTLEGNPATVSEYISKNYKISFHQNENEYVADLKEYIKLVIGPHPNLKDSSIVIGAYLGP